MMPIETVAVGFDGSPDSAAAVRWTLELAKAIGADVTFVHALGTLEHLNEPTLLADLEEAAWVMAGEAGLDSARGRWHAADGDPCSVLLRAGDPPISADLLVVGSRGTGAHPGLLLGSTGLELAEHSTIPLVIVPRARAGGRFGALEPSIR
jgi:nucleotide-binding universal stress UspA family protein